MFIEYHGKAPRVAHSAFVAPTAVLIGDVEIGEESSVWFGTVIRGDNGPIRIGSGTSIQDNSVIHVSEGCTTVIGNNVTIGHCAVLEDCTVEDGALIGSNAVVLNGARVGRRSLIGAGSVVATNAQIPDEVVAVGSPAVVKKKIEGFAAAWVDHGGPEYVKLSRAYLRHGLGDPEFHELAGSEGRGLGVTTTDTVAFLTEAGLITTVREGMEEHGSDSITFKLRGTIFTVYADDRDAEFLNVTCAYRLQALSEDKAASYEAAVALQNQYKVVKVTVDYTVPSVTVAAEQFLAKSDAFARIFWRTVDLVADVASKAYDTLNDVSVAGAAASAFTENIEQSLHLKQHEGPEPE